MTWHEDLSLEVYVEFQKLQTPHWARFEERLWIARHVEKAAWAEHGLWWRKTTAGKKYFREFSIQRRAFLKTQIVATRACIACGKLFQLDGTQVRNGRGRVCSTRCKGASRGNIELVTIDGVKMPLARWCEKYGVQLKTVCQRRKRGWDIRRAIMTPVAEGKSK
jgi:hypothetical protein